MKRSSVSERRLARGWSQDELARHSGLTRPTISAIETGRVVPSVAAALALARTFHCSVEDLFGDSRTSASVAVEPLAWGNDTPSAPFWRAEVGGRVLRYPTEPTLAGMLPADGFAASERGRGQSGGCAPEHRLVVASCDPAIGLLAHALAHTSSVELLPLARSSGAALDLLGRGLVHVAGLHLQDHSDPTGNARIVRATLGPGYSLLRISRWQEGLAFATGAGIASVRGAVRAKLRWVSREPGSGARRCLDSLLGGSRRAERLHRIAPDHATVAAAIRCGWADVGVCLRISAAQAGLQFLSIQEEDYDLCYRTAYEHDPRLRALLRAVQSRSLRDQFASLVGYDPSEMGAVQHVAA